MSEPTYHYTNSEGCTCGRLPVTNDLDKVNCPICLSYMAAQVEWALVPSCQWCDIPNCLAATTKRQIDCGLLKPW